jgi:DNA-directed RNA polymerase specialized sigma24 family protein
MSVYGQLKKAYQDELLQAAARHRLASQARRAHPPRPHHPITAVPRRTAATRLREALTHLPPRCQQLMALLLQDPPLPYAQISARLGIPTGSIGPSRARCLNKLRRHPAIAALINTEAETTQHEIHHQATGQR